MKGNAKAQAYAELIRRYFRRQNENKNAGQSKRNTTKNESLQG